MSNTYDIIYQFWNSAVLRAGIKLGIFSLLEEKQPCSCESIVNSLKSNPKFMHSFLEACVVLGLLEKEGNDYRNTKETSESLIPGKSNYIGDLALHITNYWSTWGKLDRLILEGRTELPFDNGFVDAQTYWKDYMYGQHNRAESGQIDNLIQNTDLTGRKKLLDVGGGMGSYSLPLCKAYSNLQVCLLDAKESLELARKLVRENNMSDRVVLKEGNFHTVELNEDYDVVLISGVVCITSEEENRKIFSRAFEVLEPGGLIIVQDFMQMGENNQKHFLDTMMDLYLKIAFDPGSADYPSEDIASWLTDAGFEKHKQTFLPTQLNLITAEKPR
ncbi:MAG: class I SAM-dependent methyltransferase [Cyanobacteriota bacterium]|nr:class I SAM-dependent methyltransferase [Cyanobacteriota bacterium]